MPSLVYTGPMSFSDSLHPRDESGQFTEKNGSEPDITLADFASMDFGFHVPDLLALEPSSAQNPITDPRLTGSAKTRLARLVEEKGVTALASSDPNSGAPVTMLYVGDDSIYTVGENPKTTEEALAVVVREAANGDEDAAEFLNSAFGDEAGGLLEYVAEERL